jgi:D-serine deaminase-like pyridoxal phosphate-dependent protein
MQASKGVCSFSDIAVSVFCPVVDIHPERNEFVIYGGAIHLSKEFILLENGEKNFGKVCSVTENGWGEPIEGSYVKSLSQEHGIVHGTTEFISTLKTGQLIAVLPVHSCLTAQCYKAYHTTEGKTIDHM